MGDRPHVAIVGAGFGGLGVAEQLDHVPVEVTLIEQHNYHALLTAFWKMDIQSTSCGSIPNL